MLHLLSNPRGHRYPESIMHTLKIIYFDMFRLTENNTMETYSVTGDTASHLEPDLFVEGNLLLSLNQALLTTHGKYQYIIVGNPVRDPHTQIPYVEGKGQEAVFTRITSFTQQNRTHVFLADSKHGCIREVDRLTNVTQLVAGLCKTVSFSDSYIDGPLSTATFHEISSISYHKNTLFVIQGVKMAVRKIDLVKGLVQTIAHAAEFRLYDAPRTMVIDPNSNTAYLTTFQGIAEITLGTNTFTYLNKIQGGGYRDGAISRTMWSGATEMISIGNDHMLVVDIFNGKLRVVDLNLMRVSTWCFWYQNKRCSLDRSPSSVAMMSCVLYLSVTGTIQRLKLPIWFCPKYQLYQGQQG